MPDELYHYRFNTESITHTINYDNWRADFEVERIIHAWLLRLNIFREEDFDRLRNHLLDMLMLNIKRISRFCSSRAKARKVLQRIHESEYYRGFLSIGYRGSAGDLRRMLNSIALGLLRRRCYNALIFFCTRIFRAK